MITDLRHALRLLRQSKGWTAVVLLSLALGIGANTALFSGVNQMLLQTISARDPDSLVRLSWVGENDMARSRSEYGFGGETESGEQRRTTFSYPLFLSLQEANETLSGLFAGAPVGRPSVVVDGNAEVASAYAATGEYFSVLGTRPHRGRLFGASDDDPAAEPVVVISHRYWTQRFGQSEEAIGRSIEINNVPATLIGVLPPGETGVQGPGRESYDLVLPLAVSPPLTGRDWLDQPTTWWLTIMGRLEPGATVAQVAGNLSGVFQAAAREGLDSYLDGLTPEERGLARNENLTDVPTLWVDSGRRGIYDPNPNSTRDATILSVVVVLVLLIVCANVANLLLARSTVRSQELSIRQSVGATRGRLIRQLLSESVLLSFAGGVLGLVAALWARRLLPFGRDAPLDWRVFAFVAALSLATGVAFSLLPAFRATSGDLSGTLKESARSVAGSRSLLSKVLLVAQVAVSILLLMGAGLFLGTLRNLRAVDVGFDPENVLLFRIDPRQGYDEEESRRILDEIEERLESMPGVRSASYTRNALLAGSTSTTHAYFEHLEDLGGDEERILWLMTVSPGFFETLDIGLLQGRDFEDRDRDEAPEVAIVNQAAAREFWGGESPLGRRFGFSPEERSSVEVIAVVADSKYREVRDEAPPTVFLPASQSRLTSMVFQVKTDLDPNGLLPAVRDVVASVAPRLPIMDVTTQSEEIEDLFRQERYFAASYSAFGGLAALLAAIGLFGLASYGVAQRTHEIGVRMALGALRSDVQRMVLRESLVLVVTGVAVGILASLLAGRLIQGMLFGIEPADAATMIAAALSMTLVASIAGYLPARRASRVDPMVALHHE